jgi:hypothetical protein
LADCFSQMVKARTEAVCPGWCEAERWLKRNGSLLGL